MNHKFKIIVGRNAKDCRVEMDGKPLEGVVKVAFDLSASRATVLRLDIYGEIEVEGEFREDHVVAVHEEIPWR